MSFSLDAARVQIEDCLDASSKVSTLVPKSRRIWILLAIVMVATSLLYSATNDLIELKRRVPRIKVDPNVQIRKVRSKIAATFTSIQTYTQCLVAVVLQCRSQMPETCRKKWNGFAVQWALGRYDR